MDKRKYMKPYSEAVTVKGSELLLSISLTNTLSTTTYDATPGGSLVGKKRNDIAREIDPWSWECVLWDQEVNEFEDE